MKKQKCYQVNDRQRSWVSARGGPGAGLQMESRKPTVHRRVRVSECVSHLPFQLLSPGLFLARKEICVRGGGFKGDVTATVPRSVSLTFTPHLGRAKRLQPTINVIVRANTRPGIPSQQPWRRIRVPYPSTINCLRWIWMSLLWAVLWCVLHRGNTLEIHTALRSTYCMCKHRWQ